MLYSDDYVSALETNVKGLISRWNLSSETDVRLLTVSENATFIARDPLREMPVILRLHRPNYHNVQEINSELAWISALREAGAVTTPALIPTTEGAFVVSFEDGPDTRHVVAFEFMEGSEPDADAALIPGFRLLGEISARLHSHVEMWQEPKNFTRKTWDFQSAFGAAPLWGDWRAALGLSANGQTLLDKALAKLEQRLTTYGKGPDRFGLVHADLRLANLLQSDTGLGVIDFDDCGYSWFVYDFAAAISFHELNPIVPDLTAAWLEGYKTVRPLSDADIAMIPDFIMFRRLLLTAWIASHSETETAQEAGMEDYTAGTLQIARRYLEDQE